MKAKYFDGVKPVSKEVTCHVSDNRLWLILDDGNQIAPWNLRDLAQDENVNTAFVLRNKRTGETLEFSGEPSELLPLVKSHRVRFKSKIFAALCAGVILLILTMWQLLPYFSKLIANLVTPKQEEEIARRLELTIRNDLKACAPSRQSKKALEKFLTRLNAPGVRLTIVDDPTVNAFTFPGGEIILSQGLLKQTQTPEELAGILAHELGHIEERHVLQKLVNALSTAAILHLMAGDFSSAFAIDPSTLLSIAALSFDRGMEEEADRRARDRLEANNIRTEDVANFFKRTSRNPDRYSLFTTHPGDESRQRFFLSKSPKRSTPVLTAPEWDDLRSFCAQKFLQKARRLSPAKSSLKHGRKKPSPLENAQKNKKLDFPMRL